MPVDPTVTRWNVQPLCGHRGSSVRQIMRLVCMSSLMLLAIPVTANTPQAHAPTLGASPDTPVFVKEVPAGDGTPQAKALSRAADALGATASALSEGEKGKRASDDQMIKLTAALARYTFWLFLATLALAVGTAALVRFGFVQSNDAKESIQAARKAAEAANRSADAAERSLTTIERPWLVVKAVDLPPRKEYPEGTPNAWFISFHLHNVGRSPALVEDVQLTFVDRDLIPETPDYTEPSFLHVSCDRTITAGCSAKTHPAGRAPEFTVKDGKPMQLVVYGRVLYTDLSGTPHTTGFAFGVSPYFPAYSGWGDKAFEYYT